MRSCPSTITAVTLAVTATIADAWSASRSAFPAHPIAFPITGTSAPPVTQHRRRHREGNAFLLRQPRLSHTPSALSLSNSGNDGGNTENNLANAVRSMGMNELQTQFRRAIAREDFDACILYRDELAERLSAGAYYQSESDERKEKRLSWTGLGTAPWLIERLEALEYPLPTTIQINSFEAVNAILDPIAVGIVPGKEKEQVASVEDDDEDDDDDDDDDESYDLTLEERMQVKGSPLSMGTVISGSTGSGKTLAYLIPTLSTLSQTLFTRQRIRIKAEEDVGDRMGDLLDRVVAQASPSMRGQGKEQIGGKGGKTVATGAALSSLGRSGTDVKSPVALIVVPTRELGVQIALLLYQLVGGNIKKKATEKAGKMSMFRYQGPKGVKIGCVLDAETAAEGLKLQTDVAITTPKYLSKLLRDGDVDPAKLRVVIYDEADLGLERSDENDLRLLFGEEQRKARTSSRISYLVGATVTESLGSLAVRDEILPEGHSFIATATKFAPLTKDASEAAGKESGAEAMAKDADAPEKSVGEADTDAGGASPSSKDTYQDLRNCLDPGLRHERVIAPESTGLLCLARMLRKQLRDYESALAAQNDEEDEWEDKELAKVREETKDLEDPYAISNSMFEMTNANEIDGVQRPRVVVFFPNEDDARAAMSALRDAMWGDHRLAVLLPDTGASPLAVMEDFKKGDVSVMLATPNSVRGLDFPALTNVYTLYLPADDPREYLHLAGRVGRIGQQGSVRGRGGRVTTVLHPEEASQMDQLSEFLGFEFVDVEPLESNITEESDVEDVRRYLEDTVLLLNDGDNPEEKALPPKEVVVEDYDYDDDDDDDEDDDEENIFR